jgi:phospholipid/cholesterol/gamma-HCH transport system substrate-binding protein
VRAEVAPVKSFRERRPWLVGGIGLILIAGGVAAAFSINKLPQLRGVYKLSADLKDAAGLQPGNEVRAAGVRVGRVTGVSLTLTAARIEMEIEDHVRIPVESRLEVKLKTLLGQKFIDLQLPPGYLAAASNGGDPSGATDHYLSDGDVIPIDQTRVPFEIYQAATEGTEVLQDIDKHALRRLLRVLGKTVGASKGEFARALVALDDAAEVLSPKSAGISKLLRTTKQVTGTLAGSDRDIEGILDHSANVLGVLADRRETVSSLLAATNDLARNLGLLIRSARGSIQLGVRDLNSILVLAEGELDVIETSIEELAVAQELATRPFKFGRFGEQHLCAVTTEDTCAPRGGPSAPGLPIHGVQPQSGGGEIAQ